MPTKEELFKQLSDGVVDFADETVKETAEKVLAEGLDPVEAIMGGLTAGMMRVGELFAAQEYFVPEVLLCADAMEEGMKILRPHITKAADEANKGRIILGTVEGDVHDIGKNMVKLMLEVNGYTVIDLGTDVPLDRFVEEQQRTGAEIVGLSAMMTTTMMTMKKIIPALKAVSPGVKVMLGGAPVTKDVAKLFGADGYADDAVNAVKEADRILAL